jgi:AcrR family transcriptional regulator
MRATTRVRKSAEDRRAEIVSAATRLSLSDGLDQVTLRSIAVELGIVGSLVSHYFPSVDDLLAETFAGAASAELEELMSEVEEAETGVAAMALLLRRLVDDARDNVTALWLDAWHAGRRRPALRDEVVRQTRQWNDRVTALVERGRVAGEFTVADPHAAAVRIMAVVDGLCVQPARGTIDYKSVEQLVFVVAESELGLDQGSLG